MGLPNAGKSTLFSALTRLSVEIAPYPFSTTQEHIGTISIPDERLSFLSELVKPEKVTPATIKFVDLAGLVRGAHRGEGLGNEFLGKIREVEVVVEVVRCFEKENIPHPEGKVDPVRDIEIIEIELTLADLALVERRLTKFKKFIKSENKAIYSLLWKAKSILEEGNPLRKKLSLEEREKLRGEGFLTLKPLLYVLNIGEENLSKSSETSKRAEDFLSSQKERWVRVSCLLEKELLEIPQEERKEWLKVWGIREPGLSLVVRECYFLLDLVTFFTIWGGKEVRAWPLKRGTTAFEAAGKIHSDIQRGFVQAEVCSFSELKEAGSWQKAKEEGKVRGEGKDYLIKEGDVIYFRFGI